MQRKGILIVNFGGQLTQLIARRLREAAVYCEITPVSDLDRQLSANRHLVTGIILSGGPDSVNLQKTQLPPAITSLRVPVLGICYGLQLLVAHFGGSLAISNNGEFGAADIKLTSEHPLLQGLAVTDQHPVWMSHGDHVASLPAGFSGIASSERAPYAAIADDKRRLYGLQFHPEASQTRSGNKILSNFAIVICGCKADWTMADFCTQAVEQIRQQVGGKQVLCALSGGVDSAVTAALIYRAIGAKLLCVFVDTGLLRKNEAQEVAKMFRHFEDLRIKYYDAGSRFVGDLAGITDAETKRKRIGHKFIEIFQEIAQEHSEIDFLAQGTLYPDVIESQAITGSETVTIKSHHNVGGLPDNLPFQLLEPLRSLFKDEVRQLGRELGLPNDQISRHPFPGPGLAVRLPGEVTAARIAILQQIDAVLMQELRQNNYYDKIWQAFAVLLPGTSVGVKGDARSSGYSCVIRAVVSNDGMTAEAYQFPIDYLTRVAAKISNSVVAVNRVLYDISSKPPATIEWE